MVTPCAAGTRSSTSGPCGIFCVEQEDEQREEQEVDQAVNRTSENTTMPADTDWLTARRLVRIRP